MTFTQFLKLKAGDILLFPSGAMRTVIEGPREKVRKGRAAFIELAKMNRSQYYRPTTVKCWGEVSRAGMSKLKVIGHTSALCLKAELKRLIDIGFDPRREIVRLARERIAVDHRMGRPICQKALRLSKSKTEDGR